MGDVGGGCRVGAVHRGALPASAFVTGTAGQEMDRAEVRHRIFRQALHFCKSRGGELQLNNIAQTCLPTIPLAHRDARTNGGRGCDKQDETQPPGYSSTHRVYLYEAIL